MIGSSWAICELINNGSIKIDPFDPSLLKSASYTLRVGTFLRVPIKTDKIRDLRTSPPEFEVVEIGCDGFVLSPGDFVIASSLERVILGPRIACLLSGRGSCAQLGLNVLQSSSFAEPVTDQKLNFEISNVSQTQVRLWVGMPAVKAIFFSVSDKLDVRRQKQNKDPAALGSSLARQLSLNLDGGHIQ